MNNIITQILIAIFTILLGLLFWFLKRNFDQLDKSDTKIEQKIDKIDNKLEEKIDKIDNKINNIGNRVAKIEGIMGIRYSATFSPIHLTTEGEEILVESKAKAIVDKEDNKNKILNKILAEPKPTNAYDAQEKTKQIIKEMVNDPMFVPVKDYAFHKGITIDNMLNIISIYFRGFALEKLEFKAEDSTK